MGDGMTHILQRRYFPGDIGFADVRPKRQAEKPAKKTPSREWWYPDSTASREEKDAYDSVLNGAVIHCLPLGRLSAKVTDGLLRGVLAVTNKTPAYLIERLRGIQERHR